MMTRQRSVLLIDPTENMRRLLRASLEEAGYTVQDADNGLQGIVCYQRTPTDLVIVDLVLPDLNGLDVMMELTSAHRDLKLVALSDSERTPEALREAERRGSCRVLRKPVAVEQLIRAAEELLARRRPAEGSQDRRQYPRLPARMPVTFAGDLAEGSGRAFDLSIAGCAVESDMVPIPGASLTMRLGLSDHPAPLRVDLASVRWSHGRTFGVRFLWMQPTAYAVLRDVLGQLAGPKGG